MRASGLTSSLNLSDTTLLFVKNHPLMEGVVSPMTGKPLLFKPMTHFSNIVVDQVTSLDGQQHLIMFVGTGAHSSMPVTKSHKTDESHWQMKLHDGFISLSHRYWLAAEGGEVWRWGRAYHWGAAAVYRASACGFPAAFLQDCKVH